MRPHYQVRKGSVAPLTPPPPGPCLTRASLQNTRCNYTLAGPSDRWPDAAAVGRQGRRVCSGASRPTDRPTGEGCGGLLRKQVTLLASRPTPSEIARTFLGFQTKALSLTCIIICNTLSTCGRPDILLGWGLRYKRETGKQVKLAAGGPHACQTLWGVQVCTCKQAQSKAAEEHAAVCTTPSVHHRRHGTDIRQISVDVE